MKIDHATLDDLSGLCDLLSILFSQEAEFQPDRALQEAGLRQIIEAPELGRILALRDGTSIVGMVNLLFTVSTALGGKVCILEDMVVHPEHRGKGAGSKLLEAAIEFSKAAGCLRITLLTDRTNESAQRFYRRHGFTPSAMLPMRLGLDAS